MKQYQAVGTKVDIKIINNREKVDSVARYSVISGKRKKAEQRLLNRDIKVQ